LELDQLYQRLGMPDEFRLARYEENISLIDERDDLYTEYVTLLNLSGQYEKAYEMIVSHNFRTWEGAEGKITAQFKLCLYAIAKKALGEGNAVLAKEKVLEALSYPENLGEGKLEGTKDNNLYYLLAEIAESLSDKELMKDSLERAVLGVSEPAGMMYYYDQPADMILYQGLAYEKLGKKAEANRRFYKLIDYGEHHLRDKFVMDYFAVSMPDMSVFDNDMDKKNETFCYYLMGLGNIGLGRRTEAKKWFKKALDIENTHQLSRFYASII
jgi:tetratricopeptide (TPR) repeat protein